MAEVSHYEMKTLAAAAGGLRLPTLPVAVAFVRACGGNVAEWEDRWQKLAEKITADAARKRRNDGEENAEPLEPADAPAALEPPVKSAAAQPPRFRRRRSLRHHLGQAAPARLVTATVPGRDLAVRLGRRRVPDDAGTLDRLKDVATAPRRVGPIRPCPPCSNTPGQRRLVSPGG